MTSNPELADDLLQEAFFHLLRTPHPPLEREACRKYVFTIASNLARDWFRREKRNLEDLVEGADGIVEPSVPLRFDMAAVLQNLTARERQLLWLAYAEGFSHAEIAEITGLQVGSIRPMLFHSRRKAADGLRAIGYRPQKGKDSPHG